MIGLAAAAATALAAACQGAEARQFDFWLGQWEVVETRTGKPAGHSRIERLFGGCALGETWSEPGFTGGSLNHYDPAAGRWRQTWTDSAGAWREFVGGIEAGRMVLVARQPSAKAPGHIALVRMSFTANPDGTVRQYSDVSLDDGATWAERYDYTYRHPSKARPR